MGYRCWYKKVLLWGMLMLPCSLWGQINTDRVMMIARHALYYEDYVLSIQYFNQVIGAKPYLYQPYFYRSLAKLNLEDFTGAEQDCDSVLRRNPFFVDAYQVRGLARIRQKDIKGAIVDYQKVLQMSPENVGAWRNLALCYLENKKYDDAYAALDRLLDVRPKYALAYLFRGDVDLQVKDTAKAYVDYNRALELAPFEPMVYGSRGRLYLQQKQYVEAEKDFTQAVRLDNQNEQYLVNRALSRYHQDNFRGAMNDYDLALTVAPYSFIAHYNRGLLRAQVGDTNRALEDFDFVLTIDPEEMMATFNRGQLRNDVGNYQGAVEDYSKVIAEYPQFKAGYHYRAQAYRKLGKTSLAVKDEDTLLRLNLDSYEASQKARQADKTSQGNQKGQDKALADNKDESNEDTKTRKRSNRNIANYRKLMIADQENNMRKYESGVRGRVQNKNVDIKLEPSFALTYYEKDSEVRNDVHFDKNLDELNRSRVLPVLLHLTNQEKALTEEQVKKHFEWIDTHSTRIVENPEDAVAYFARALDFYVVQDFDEALNDLDVTVKLDNTMYLAYFARAVVRLKQLESKLALARVDGVDEQGLRIQRQQAAVDYEQVENDLKQVIKIAPDFAYAYYNMANLQAQLKDFKAAMVNYNEAIRLEPRLGVAYFNRGLTHIFLGEVQVGVQDLSLAGQHGVVSAYNIIKRYAQPAE